MALVISLLMGVRELTMTALNAIQINTFTSSYASLNGGWRGVQAHSSLEFSPYSLMSVTKLALMNRVR